MVKAMFIIFLYAVSIHFLIYVGDRSKNEFVHIAQYAGVLIFLVLMFHEVINFSKEENKKK